MERKAFSGIVLTLLLISMLTLAFNIQPVEASRTIYIRADGSVDPHTAPITHGDNFTYTFTDNIYESIVVERDNVVVDGASYTLQGTGATGSRGIDLTERSNVTIKNMRIQAFYYGIRLEDSSNSTIIGNNITANGWDGIQLYRSSNNTVSGNDITENYDYGIWLHSSSNCNVISGNNITKNRCYGIYHWRCSYNKMSGNNIIANGWSGFYLDWSPNNSICSNNITANGWDGIYLYESSNNIMSGNSIINNNQSGFEVHFSSKIIISENNITANSGCGIFIALSYGNYIYHNNFVENTISQATKFWYVDAWDDDYPSGGNYWSDHVTVDEYSGINQDELGSDGIVDEPYIIDAYNQDNYPLTEPWTPLPRTIYELKTEIEELGSEGKIDNQGIVKSLMAKLNVAQKLVDKGKVDEVEMVLEGFIMQVQELSGIHITVEAADILIQSAEYILSHL